ncbi:hypothetical protein R4P47_15730 [Rhodococcus sp. IEGM 1370]|jgi:hypothetical protein|uniref:hypothetical protein n=1 Tax=Rhodococcus sp. IEGM 1370 TaxID=3082222 RepID=UPI00295359A3|nr:hypothetical protein [Rhodococcus sp. IEGM 1370]MDV8078013.1 hypothetical protein [Rhodococcus sp. IEGM 1370]
MSDYENEDEFEIIDLTSEAPLDPDEVVNLPDEGDGEEHSELEVQRIGADLTKGRVKIGTVGKSRLITFMWVVVSTLGIFAVVTGIVTAALSAGWGVLIGGAAALAIGAGGWRYVSKDHKD